MMINICDVAGWGYIRDSRAHRTSSLSFNSHKLKATAFTAAAECGFDVKTQWRTGLYQAGYSWFIISSLDFCLDNRTIILAPYLANGDYVVVANKEGYFQTESATQTLTNAEITPLDLFLISNPATNTGTISGLITSQTTLLPIANATVALYQIVGTIETIIQITKTNSGGRYLFGDVAEGQYVVKSFAQINAA